MEKHKRNHAVQLVAKPFYNVKMNFWMVTAIYLFYLIFPSEKRSFVPDFFLEKVIDTQRDSYSFCFQLLFPSLFF